MLLALLGTERADDVGLLEDAGGLGVIGAVEGALDAVAGRAGLERPSLIEGNVVEANRLDRVRRQSVEVLELSKVASIVGTLSQTIQMS